MPDGGELIIRTVLAAGDEVAGETREPHVEIEVIDTGVGIPPEQLTQVFRPYVSSKREGTGLGLPTVLRIVRLHGGGIQVESEPGQGSRFVVELPIESSGSDEQ